MRCSNGKGCSELASVGEDCDAEERGVPSGERAAGGTECGCDPAGRRHSKVRRGSVDKQRHEEQLHP